MLLFLDLILFALHIAVIGFNLFGWIPRRWRRAHLVVVALTLFSWIILGFWYGFGYCFLTDIEWDIKRELGETNLPGSFITYLTNNILGMSLSSKTVDIITVGAYVPAVLVSLYLNFKPKRK
ncbi:DUF2784 family protein [Fulvivirga sp. RKSG066]|uniref:DUF2784 domain-containing protein n=1 Tax=Fulvivirga aurantia TaxID=2529383 RepID=UPI0012BD561C|nr:DUF2784 domain-containing protein [Fulvivirga aurantia]MTI22894.1 DUF2784 family protein [Fulvivirga aurantia]